MALNMATDKEFNDALSWLAKQEAKTKSDVVRELVLERFRAKRRGFGYGSLKTEYPPVDQSEIERDLKSLDDDHDLA